MFGSRNPVGVKVAVAPVQETVPVTGPVAAVTVKVPVVTVEQFNAEVGLSESWRKFAAIVWLTATPVAPLAGLVETTEGTSTASKCQT